MTTKAQLQPAVSPDEIRRLVAQDMPRLTLQTPGPVAAAAALQGKPRAVIRHPRLALFLAAHGAHPEKQQDLGAFTAGLGTPSHPLQAAAAAVNADLKVYELDLSRPSGDFTRESAMSADETAHAVAYGMMAVQPGVDILCLAAANPVAADAAAEIGKEIAKGTDAFDALCRFGGFDLAACLGAAIAARLAKSVVVTEGSAGIVIDIMSALNENAAVHAFRAEDLLGSVLTQDMTAGGKSLATAAAIAASCSGAAD